MPREEMIKELIKEMTENCSFFSGNYNAKNVNENFMYGILTTMGYLAFLVSDDFGYEFENNFIENMIKSEKKVLTDKE